MWVDAVHAWEREFRETVAEVIADGGLTEDLSVKAPLLEKLSDILEHEEVTKDDTIIGSMLALWIVVVGNVGQVSVMSYKYTCFRLMTALLRRPEFKLQGLAFDFNTQVGGVCATIPSQTTQDVRKEGDPEAWRRIHLVRKLVCDTFVYSSALLLHDNQSDETHRFCALVAAHAYFVFPMLQPQFVDVCAWRYCHHQAISVSSVHMHLTDAVRALSLQPTHTEFMDNTPDLFHWGWLAKPTDMAILPDESTWRLLLDANDGHLFCAFVQAFHDYIDQTIRASASHVSVVQWGMVPGYMQLAHVFGVVLYDALTTMTAMRQPDELHYSKRLHAIEKVLPSTTLFVMSPGLCAKVLTTATTLAKCGHVVQLWLAVAIAAAKDAGANKANGVTMSPLLLEATTAWIEVAANSHDRVTSFDATTERFQNLLLYPSCITLQAMVAHVASFVSAIPDADENGVVAVLVWMCTHIQRLRVEDRAVLVTAVMDRAPFYALFLHWDVLGLCHDGLRPFLAGAPPSTPVSVADKPAQLVMSDSPSLLLDLSVASKLDTFLYVLQHPPTTTDAASRMFPEALDIFVEGALVDYAVAVQEYYDRCIVVETSGNDPIKATEVIEGPALASVLVQQRKRHV
ncbi:hypothetical protein DYB32_007473 [Aphanomyces invadans]|uniref:Uncharacterized protein n=1 Tax=Aphanomyces invadans TaxID=157072 RepID=A0A3R6ZLI4_9STRA|nr:hypothetical protein DYB32_007473 [Aphanomyces invadans]